MKAAATAALLLLAAVVAGVAFGGVPLSLSDLWSGHGQAGETARLVASLRLPRVALAALVGACLALSGAALQALLKNPLADPFLLGISRGASVGAALATLADASPLLSPVAAFVGATGSSIVRSPCCRVAGTDGSQRLLLAGLIATRVLLRRAPRRFRSPREAERTMLFWMMGSLAQASPAHVAALLPTARRRRGAPSLGDRLNLFAVGEENAAALGVDTERSKRLVFLAAALLTGAAAAFAGIIGFVGLLVPHAVRSVAGNDQRVLLPLSAISGAALLVGADAASRALLAPAELPIGAVTAALGAPSFHYLLLRSTRTRFSKRVASVSPTATHRRSRVSTRWSREAGSSRCSARTDRGSPRF
jgi:iron complex transport system permease protein